MAVKSDGTGAGTTVDAVQKQSGKENEVERRRRRRKQKKKGKHAVHRVGGDDEEPFKAGDGDRNVEEVRLSLRMRPGTSSPSFDTVFDNKLDAPP